MRHGDPRIPRVALMDCFAAVAMTQTNSFSRRIRVKIAYDG
jgi:hypothetical protein